MKRRLQKLGVITITVVAIALATYLNAMGWHWRSIPVHWTLTVPLSRVSETPLLKPRSSSDSYLFPSLDVYDKNGLLILRGRQITENLTIISRLSNLGDSKNILEEPTLEERLCATGQDSKALLRALKNGRITVLSIMLEQCESCSVQQQALDALQNRGAVEDQINTVSVMVSLRPR
jgi:hypothetical protein